MVELGLVSELGKENLDLEQRTEQKTELHEEELVELGLLSELGKENLDLEQRTEQRTELLRLVSPS